MLSIFNLENYKEYLISYYFYKCDNNIDKKMERQRILEHRYSDEYLQDIILNTYEFAFNLLESCQDNCISIDITKENDYIFTNCTGGYHPDVLISLDPFDEEKKISKFLLERFLGSDFKTYFDNAETEVYDEFDGMILGCVYEIPKFVIVGDFSKKREALRFEKQNELMRTLKKVSENL